MLKVSVIPADRLPPEAIAAWSALQRNTPELRHPMLSSLFTRCVARHRTDVQVAVIESAGDIVGLFPYQRDRGRIASPVGFRLNDYQGGIFAPGTEIDSAWLMRRCDLSAWHFDHLIASQQCFADGHFELEDSPYIDLSDGLSAYLEGVAGRARWQSNIRNARRMERDHGPVRFVFQSTDPTVFESLIAWKTDQIRASGKRCVFDWPWVQRTLADLREAQDDVCAGRLSALYAGDRLAAVHFGLQSRDVLHWWITAYNTRFSAYSPGALLLTRLIEHVAGNGTHRIELGKGHEPYKDKLKSDSTPLASGAVCASAWGRLRRRAFHVLQESIRSSRFAAPAKAVLYRLEAMANRSADGSRR